MEKIFLIKSFLLFLVVFFWGFSVSASVAWPEFSFHRKLNDHIHCNEFGKECFIRKGKVSVKFNQYTVSGDSRDVVTRQVCKIKIGMYAECVKSKLLAVLYNSEVIHNLAVDPGMSVNFESLLIHEVYHYFNHVKGYSLKKDIDFLVGLLEYPSVEDRSSVMLPKLWTLERYLTLKELCRYASTGEEKYLNRASYHFKLKRIIGGRYYLMMNVANWDERTAHYVAYKYQTKGNVNDQRDFVLNYCKNLDHFVNDQSANLYSYAEGVVMGYLLDKKLGKSWRSLVNQGSFMPELLLQNVESVFSNNLDDRVHFDSLYKRRKGSATTFKEYLNKANKCIFVKAKDNLSAGRIDCTPN